ncbi:MAG: 50S ribosome-binding GTPase, partial [Armatimonadetes bacterium]|nr:50S ribosome-binding GTPase [Armatimonadota bacterium]
MQVPVPSPRPLRVAIAGNPNAGKSSIFNALTGLRQKVGNYPGVTVERKLGRCQLGEVAAEVIDLPGAYSLTVQSPDEEVARDVLLGWLSDHEPPPDVVVVVVDATNLQRNLFLASQIIELGYPTVIALNMTDLATAQGAEADPQRLGQLLGVPVVPTVASRGEGLEQLKATVLEARASSVRAPMAPALEA